MIWGRYGCPSHDLLAAKLNVYALEPSAVYLIFDYFTNKNQQTKTDCHHSSQRRSQDSCKHPRWKALKRKLTVFSRLIFFAVTQGSILRPKHRTRSMEEI